MKKIVNVRISMAKDGTYSVYSEDCPALFGMGNTIPEAKKEFLETVGLTRSIGKESALCWPEWLDDDCEFEYRCDVVDFLNYYAGVITPAALGRISGINPKQIWNYMHGKSKPRRAQVDKIENALHKLGSELMNVSF